MTAVYTPNIPQSNDDPTLSQPYLLGNFTKLNTDWSVDHITLVAGGNVGFHTKIGFPNVLGSDPSPVNQQSFLYPKAGPDMLPALFFKNASNTYQLTNLPIVNSGNNWGFVTPWGLTVNTGFATSVPATVTFAIPFVNGNFYTVQVTPNVAVATSATAVTNTTLTIPGSAGATKYFYLVIGN